MGDVTRPAPGSLGGGANESAVGGGSAARAREAEGAGMRCGRRGPAGRLGAPWPGLAPPLPSPPFPSWGRGSGGSPAGFPLRPPRLRSA